MNFFQAQRKAKQNTSLLLLLLGVAVFLLLLLTLLLVFAVMSYYTQGTFELSQEAFFLFLKTPLALYVSIGLLFSIIAGSIYKKVHLGSGGHVVALSLGGRKVHSNTQNAQERTVLNVVEEMAIASGITIPALYLLPDRSINAFAAGLRPNEAVIGVTQGLIETLTRDELQGVIAHEFSHIFNGDMRLNLNITALLHGILLLGLTGKVLLRIVANSSLGNRKRSKEGNINVALGALGVGLLAIGYTGFTIGAMIKALVSQKREYLADATAVQYTRNPSGIANALKKIASLSGAKLASTQTSTFSHLFFANAVSSFWDALFATHPPIEKRIRSIEPSWDGTFTLSPTHTNEAKQKPESDPLSQKTAIAIMLAKMGTIPTQSTQTSHALLQAIDPYFLEQTKDALSAQALVLMFLTEEKVKKAQWDHVQKQHSALLLPLAALYSQKALLARAHILVLLHLCVATLKELSPDQYHLLKALMHYFITCDDETSLFEWSLQTIVTSTLDRHFNMDKKAKEIHYFFGSVTQETQTIYSLLCYEQAHENTLAQRYFERTTPAMRFSKLQYRPRERITFTDFLYSMSELRRCKPHLKQKIFEGILAIVMVDETIVESEKELLHAIALLLELPLPLTA